MSETTWTRFRRKKPLILRSDLPGAGKCYVEYEVETIAGRPIGYSINGEPCRKIRTVRSHYLEAKGFKEEHHIPARTYMPAEHFLELYERVG